MTNEGKIAGLIIRNILGTITDAEKEELEKWRTASSANQQLFEQYSGRENLAAAFNRRTARNKRISQQLEQFVQEQRAATPRIHFIQRWKWVAAASVVLFLGIAAYLLSDIQQDHPQHSAVITAADIAPGKEGAILTLADGSRLSLDSVQNGVIAMQDGVTARVVNGSLVYEGNGNKIMYNTMTTPKGRQYQLTLPDGTKVWLNAASSVRYPTVFDAKERIVEVTGEAYLEVSKNVSSPFRVFVNDRMNIDVLGTSFNINAYPGEKAFYTTLINGAVRVSSATPGNNAVLKPAQQALLSEDASLSVTSNVDTDKVLAWKNGVFNFEGATLEYMMKEIERWYDIEVIYQKGIPDIKFWGKITKDVPLSGMLIALEKTKVRFRLENNRKLVVLP